MANFVVLCFDITDGKQELVQTEQFETYEEALQFKFGAGRFFSGGTELLPRDLEAKKELDKILQRKQGLVEFIEEE